VSDDTLVIVKIVKKMFISRKMFSFTIKTHVITVPSIDRSMHPSNHDEFPYCLIFVVLNF
jgi:hypothetical protein